MKMRLALSMLAMGFTAGSVVAAENWPTKPVRFICPYVAGGAADIFSRTI